MEFTRFYNSNNPKEGEIVLCLVKERNQEQNIIKLHLIDYHKNAIMSFKKATLKKKVRSWNKILPLNKEIICKVESIDERQDETFIELSKAYIDINSDIVKTFHEEQKNNYKLKAIFKMLENIYENFDYKKKWEEIVYPFDKQRKDQGSNMYLYNYIINNYEYFLDKFNEEQKNHINNFVNKSKKTKKLKYKTKFGLYSKYFYNTVDIIRKSKENYDVEIKIDKTPYFIINGDKEDILKVCNNIIKYSSEKDKSHLLQNHIDKFKLEKY
jgi:hypothetical protein